jgi:hypothetical protein
VCGGLVGREVVGAYVIDGLDYVFDGVITGSFKGDDKLKPRVLLERSLDLLWKGEGTHLSLPHRLGYCSSTVSIPPSPSNTRLYAFSLPAVKS